MEINNNLKILIGIPAYNEEKAIGGVVESLTEILLKDEYDMDCIVFDDGSLDDTIKVAGNYKNVKVDKVEKNGGYGKTLFRMYRYAKAENYDILIVHDGDGQHDAVNIESLYSMWSKTGANVIIASRFKNGAHKYSMPFTRKVGKVVWQIILKVVWGTDIGDPSSGNILLDKKAINDINAIPEKFHDIFFNFFMLAYFCKHDNRLAETEGVFHPADNCSMHSNLFKSIIFYVKNVFYGLYYK